MPSIPERGLELMNEHRIYETDDQDPIADDSMEVLWHEDRGQWSQNYASAVSRFGPPDFGPLQERAYLAILRDFHLLPFASRLPEELVRRSGPAALREIRARFFREGIEELTGEIAKLQDQIQALHERSSVYPSGNIEQIQNELDRLWEQIGALFKQVRFYRTFLGNLS